MEVLGTGVLLSTLREEKSVCVVSWEGGPRSVVKGAEEGVRVVVKVRWAKKCVKGVTEEDLGRMEWEWEWEWEREREREGKLRCEEDLNVGEKRECARSWMEGRRRGRTAGILVREA